MTREEAISQLNLTSWAQRDQGNHYLADALDMAIKALEQEPCKIVLPPAKLYKVNLDLGNLPKMENDPIGEEIERQFALRAAELKAESEEG